MTMHSAGASQDPSQGAGERGELVQTLSKETLGSPDASELGSPRSSLNFDLLNMVVSYKRMTLFLEPIADAVELTRFLLGCVCVFVCRLHEHHFSHFVCIYIVITDHIHPIILEMSRLFFISQVEDAPVLSGFPYFPQYFLLYRY